MTRTDYKTDWQAYAYPENNMIADDEDIMAAFTEIDLSAERFSCGGIPLLVKDCRAWLNPGDENTIIFGETGSKKTRTVISPLIAVTAGAGESAFITDVKGELSSNPVIQGYTRARGIKTVYLDFRSFEGDGYNVFELPFRYYVSGDRDRAQAMIMRMVSSLAEHYKEARDPFWAESAQQYLVPLIMMIFEYCSRDESRYDMVNMLSVNAFTNKNGTDGIKAAEQSGILEDLCSPSDRLLLNGVVDNPDTTLACIMSLAQSLLKDFTIQKKLLRMLSGSTFDVRKMYEEPTFVFLIVPDETDAYDMISGMLLDMFCSTLIETYGAKYQNSSRTPLRVNYICDEFCNLQINDMRSKISASRSRNMRWFLVCQSRQQLDSVYPGDAGTIIGNCKNILFLQSSDTSLLDFISDMCGTSDMAEDGGKEPLVTREMLRSLKKERDYKEALFIRGDLRYFAELPDIGSYGFLMKYSSGVPFVHDNRISVDIRFLTPGLLNGWGRTEDDCGDYDDDYDDYDYDDDDDYGGEDEYEEDDEDDDYDERMRSFREALKEKEEQERLRQERLYPPDAGELSAEEISQNSENDMLPGEAGEVIRKKLSSLFGKPEGDNDSEDSSDDVGSEEDASGGGSDGSID